ncbi:elmMI [Symbiodinium sp. KB8]|nr:elmMI [Symbiodinium sp. KB8]
MEPSALSRYYAWLPWRATSLSSPLTAWRLFSHSLGHGGWDHLQHNLMLLCLVGPPCERHYGSTAVFRVLICCSVAVAISHWTLGPRNAQIFGLSGNVFALITLNGFAGFTGGRKAVPATALLTMVLWLAGEIGPLLHGKADGISHASHLVGALFGSYCGYAVGWVITRLAAASELMLTWGRRSGWNASAGDGEARSDIPNVISGKEPEGSITYNSNKSNDNHYAAACVFGHSRETAERSAQDCHHTLRLCNGQAKDLRALFYQGQGARGALVADALAYGSCTEFQVPTCLSEEMRMEFFELDAGGQENWLAASVFGRGMPAQRAILQQVAHDNYFAAFGVSREWLPRILVFASHVWVSGYVLELRTDQNQKIDLRHGDSVQLRASKSYEVVLTPRERGGQKPCREAALDFLARPGQLHSVMYFRGDATGKEGLFFYPGDASAPRSAEEADPAPWRDCEDMSPAILESPWPRDHRNAQMGDRGLVLTHLFHLLDQDQNLLLDISEQAQLLRHAPAELAGNIRRWERRWQRESDAAGNINFSMFLAAVEHTQALSLGKVLRRLRLEVEANPPSQKPRPSWWGLGTSWGAPEGPNPACWSEALRYADCCDDKSNTTCWTEDYDWELCCAEPEPWQIWETPPEQPGGGPGAQKAPLSQLMLEAGSDKAQNGYCPIYEVLLQPLKVQRLLEVGLGTQIPGSLSSMAGLGPGFRPGASLRAWRDYLPQAFIYGLDVMPDAMVRGEARIRTALADSANEGHVATVMKSWGFASAPGRGAPRGVFDVVVDDGLHSPEAQIATLGSLWPWLKRGGIFVVEDINDGKPMLQRASAAIEGIVGKAPYFFVDNFLNQSSGRLRHGSGLLILRKP